MDSQKSSDKIIEKETGETGERKITENITLGPDGKYRWVFSMSLFKNPTVFLLVFKILFFIVLAGFAVMFLFNVGKPDFFPKGALETLAAFGIATAAVLVLTGAGYLIYAAIMRGKYIVEFEMDERGINHTQIPWQAKRAEGISMGATAAGVAGGGFGAVSAGAAASRTSMYTEFAKVKKIKVYPRRNLIKLNETLEHNQVYCEKEDLEFVLAFIREHCPGGR